jgi:hypothetical protein
MGDQELSNQMENFLIKIKKFKLKNKKYFADEIGNYYGYDDHTMGAKRIINIFLPKIGIKKITHQIITHQKNGFFFVKHSF